MDLLLITLRKAAGYDELLDAAFLLEGRQLQNFVDGFLLCALDKAAGVHDRNIRKRRVVMQLEACIFKACHQHFAVHLIFCTAKADHAHFDRHI